MRAKVVRPWLDSLLPKEQSDRTSLWSGFDLEHESAMATQLFMFRASLSKQSSSMFERGITAHKAMTWLSPMLVELMVQFLAPMLTESPNQRVRESTLGQHVTRTHGQRRAQAMEASVGLRIF